MLFALLAPQNDFIIHQANIELQMATLWLQAV